MRWASGKSWDGMGEKAVRQMLDYYKIHDVTIQEQDGIFNDRYIPGTKTMLLCRVSSQSPSLLGLATALHQAGIAVQHHRAKIMMAGKAIALFFSRMAALLATIAIPFMLSSDCTLYWTHYIYHRAGMGNSLYPF